MIGRGAHDRQAQRDVDRLVEGDGLDRDQRLVVVHGDHRVVVSASCGRWNRLSAAIGPSIAMPLCCRSIDRRPDDVAILGADAAAFAGMRVEAGDRELRLRRCRSGSAGRARRSCTVSRISLAVIRPGTSRSGTWMVSGTTRRLVVRQHHHRRRRAAIGAQRRQIFGMAGIFEAGIVERRLVDRRGDQARGRRRPASRCTARAIDSITTLPESGLVSPGLSGTSPSICSTGSADRELRSPLCRRWSPRN